MIWEKGMERKVKLTISILISKRPDTVRKCLDSVKPLLEAVDSELILTDTGCGEEVRRIIEEYTDHILDFEWCKDFSKARNLGLKEAKGEWFLFLDDDEWFEDVSELITFFNSGEYKNYGMAVYYQRNYMDLQGVDYEDLAVGRTIKLEKDIRFEYAIHECFNRVPGATKVLNAFVHHYGYVYSSQQERMAHSERNVSLLLKEHAKDPYNLKHIIQLVQEYNAMERYEESLEMSLRGIEYEKKHQITQDFCRNSLYVNVIRYYFEKQEYERLVERATEYLEKEKLDELAKAVIYQYLVAAYYEIKEYEKSLEAGREYWKRYEAQLADAQIYIRYITNITARAFRPGNINIMISVMVRSCLAMQDYEEALLWLKKLNLKEEKMIFQNLMIDDMVEVLPEASESKKAILVQMCNLLVEREELEDYLIGCIEKKCFTYQEEKTEVLLSYRQIQGQSAFFAMIDFLGKMEENRNIEELTDQFISICNSCIDKCFRGFLVYGVWERARKAGMDVGYVIESITYSLWDQVIRDYCKLPFVEEKKAVNQWILSLLDAKEIHRLSWEKSYRFGNIIQEAKDMEGKEGSIELLGRKEAWYDGLRQYAAICKELYSRIYRPEILAIDLGVLPKEGQAGYYIEEWFLRMKEKQYGKAVAILKLIKKQIPQWYPIVKICLAKIESLIEESKKEQDEFHILGKQLKNKAIEYMNEGKGEEAKMILTQLKAMMPQDKEIELLLKKLV